jgi:hypothetical protein
LLDQADGDRLGSKSDGPALAFRAEPAPRSGPFGKSKRIFDVNAEIADRALNLGVAKQDLNCSEVPVAL